jgi:hypothetical protein
MRGYISHYWHQLQKKSYTNTKGVTQAAHWDILITKVTLELHRKIWEDRNLYVHGTTIYESNEKARAAVIQSITVLYKDPPKLNNRYNQINEVPLEHCLRRSTKELQDWMTRIKNQMKVTDLINNTKLPGQLTIQQAYARYNKLQTNKHQYPP